MLEMRLLHHFIVAVVPTLPVNDEKWLARSYINILPKLAFANPFLLNLVLSIAALHLDTVRSESPRSVPIDTDDGVVVPDTLPGRNFRRVHEVYLDEALRQQRAAVNQASPENADALMVFSSWISLFALKILPNTYRGTTYPTDWLRLSGSVSYLAEYILSMIPEKSLFKETSLRGPDLRNVREALNSEYTKVFASLLTGLEISKPDVDRELIGAYEKAVTVIGSIHTAIRRGESRPAITRRLGAFGPFMAKAYIELIAINDPRALVILAHFFAMTLVVGDVWWFKGAAEREIPAILQLLPDEWLWGMQWPLTKLAAYREGRPII